MMRLMTEEEIRAWREKVERLYASPKIEDQLVGVLMDEKIGSSGEREDVAREKVKAILARLRKA